MITKIIIQQTRQVKQYEPRKIEIHIEPSNENWEQTTKEAIEKIDKLLYPEAYEPQVTKQDLKEADNFPLF